MLSRLLPVLAAAVALVAAPLPSARAAESPPATTLIDALAYADDAAARAAWQAMDKDIAPASVAEIDGKKALRLRCNFKGTRIQRGSWDKAVTLDLTASEGIQFKVLCRDTSSIGSFSFYLQSGDGWYNASFAPTERTGWSTVEIRKEDMGTEDKPGGWASIRTIRVSAWRGGNEDAEFFLSDLRLLAGDPRIVIVRGESAVKSDAEGIRQYTGNVAQFLRDLGLPYSVVSDLDLTSERLKETKLVILPFNPSLPDTAADAITKFVAGGGKMIAFFTLPGNLASVAGVQWKGHVPQKFPGHFASIRFVEGQLPGAPASVGQMSWNIMDMRPVEGRSRLAAEWCDKDGQGTGYPAVIANDSCIYMTHVLLANDPAAKRRMLLAMIGKLVPEFWKLAAARTVEAIGRFGAFQSGKECQAAIRTALAARDAERVKAAEGKCGEANQHEMQAIALLGDARYPEAVQAADKAQHLLMELWCMAQTAPAGEHRAFWCHSPFGVAGMEWDAAVKRLADNGFTAIIPNMCWGGSAAYPSEVLPLWAEAKGKADPLAACLAACRKYGVKCHIWKVNWNTFGRAPKDFVEKMKAAGRFQVNFAGKPQDDWLCPSHPENQKLEIDAMTELATKFEVDGIHFDYIRYPNEDGCFCPGCRERFEKALGRAVAHWPADTRNDAATRAAWLDFRRDQITRVVAGTSSAVRQARPKVRISAAVFANWPADRDGVGQDWKLWCDKGYLDFVCPMDYTASPSEFEGLVERQIVWAGKVPVYPGIGLGVWTPACDVMKTVQMITAARARGARGFTIFEYTAATARDVVPMLGMGITKP